MCVCVCVCVRARARKYVIKMCCYYVTKFIKFIIINLYYI